MKALLAPALEGADFEAGFRVAPRSGQIKHVRAVGRRVGRDVDPPIFMGSWRQLLAAQDAEIASALANYLAAIALYKALGGGWDRVALPGDGPDGSPSPADSRWRCPPLGQEIRDSGPLVP